MEGWPFVSVKTDKDSIRNLPSDSGADVTGPEDADTALRVAIGNTFL